MSNKITQTRHLILGKMVAYQNAYYALLLGEW